MASRTIENYLKQLYLEQRETPEDSIAMGRLAVVMGVVPGTATSMVKALADSGLVHYEPRTGVRLTTAGQQLALHVIRRHRLVELFLVKTVGLDWSEVHVEAEELEHVISDRLLERIDELLGHPLVDPHGDPIPSAGGTVRELEMPSFVNCALGQALMVARVVDQERGFLQFANQSGLMPGAKLEVLERNVNADLVTVRAAGREAQTMSTSAAAKFLVSPAGKSRAKKRKG